MLHIRKGKINLFILRMGRNGFNSRINSEETNLIPSTAKTQNGANFELRNMTASNINVNATITKTKEEFRSTLPSLKYNEHGKVLQNFTNESINQNNIVQRYFYFLIC